jgi:hypothetical protein
LGDYPLAIDLADLGYDPEFEIKTTALGAIRCGGVTNKQQREISSAPIGRLEEPRKFACLLLSVVGKRVNPPDDSPDRIAFEDAERLSNDEIESFAQQFLQSHNWHAHQAQREDAPPVKDAGQTATDCCSLNIKRITNSGLS